MQISYFRGMMICRLTKIRYSAALWLLWCSPVAAQTDSATIPAADTIWRSGGITSLNISQVSLSNWAAGGEDLVSANALVSVFANKKSGNWAWDNTLDMALGGSRTGDAEFRKTDDKIDLNSKAGYMVRKDLYAAFLLNFKTQFTEGFTYSEDNRTRISHLLTPGYAVASLGIDWKPAPVLALFISPITLKTTMVNDPLLVDQYELAEERLYGVDPGKKIRNEPGAYFSGNYTKSIMENVVFKTKLELFSNYSNNPQNIDVNWETIITLKVNAMINALVTAQILYDDDVKVPKEDTVPGPGTQFKETFSIGFAWNFNGYGLR